MGNQQGSQRSHAHDHHRSGTQKRPSLALQDEPLEAYLREKQRNDHLKNLGLKRHTSLRKSISKKLKRHKKDPKDPKTVTDGGPIDTIVEPNSAECSTSSKIQKSHCDVHEDVQPFRRPSYTGGSQPNLSTKAKSTRTKKGGMDNLRKSFRASLRRKKDKDHSSGHGTTGDFVKDRTGGSSKSKLWQQDEIAVRAGTCSFDVKYLGCSEVYESRGMNICEEALKKLKTSKKKSVRAILYVNGDGLRVVDHETKGLLVDQTIEKVSFCAPDHNYERGFSYICRDGTTRRWMCHGFMAVKETGDRLSHAVGCAFAICLEKKQKRDQECAVTMNFDNKNSSFTRIGSFRQATITERLVDPQGVKPSEPPPKPVGGATSPNDSNPFAIARPHATDLMLQRQTSFREFSRLQSRTSPFKRQLSLRMSELPSSLERKNNDAAELGSSNHVVQNSDPFGELCEQFKNQAFFSPSNSINSSLYTKAELTPVPEDEDISPSLPPPMMASPIKPLKPSAIIEEDPILEEEELEESIISENEKSFENSATVQGEKLSTTVLLPFDSENPWDLVPDQPAKVEAKKLDNIISTKEAAQWSNSKNNEQWSNVKNNDFLHTTNEDDGHNLMVDPFDADWVNMAIKTTNQQQPF